MTWQPTWDRIDPPNKNGRGNAIDIAVATPGDGQVCVFVVDAYEDAGRVLADKGVWARSYLPGARKLPWDLEWRQVVDAQVARVSAASWAPGRYDVLASRADSVLQHLWGDRRWSGVDDVEDLRGDWTGSVLTAVAAQGVDSSDVVYMVPQRREPMFVHRWYDPGSGWSDWVERTTVLDGVPFAPNAIPIAATSWAAGRLDFFAVSAYGDVWHDWFERDWAPANRKPEQLDSEGHSFTDVSASSTAGRLTVAGVGDNEVYVKTWDNGWSRWEQLPSPKEHLIFTGIAVSCTSRTRTDVFAIGADRRLLHNWQD